MLQCTCNGFKADMVRDQWKRIRVLWNRTGGLGEILGPLVGHGSDGDARRESAMLADMRAPGTPDDNGATAGSTYMIPWEGITLVGSVDEHGVFCLHSQDTIHNAKKLLNPMDQMARILQIGDHVVVWEHVGRAADYIASSQHDIRLADVERKDRQNFEVVMRVSSPRSRAAVSQWGRETKEDVKGTVAWLEIIHLYLLAFFGKKITMARRFELL